jgi:hypothetical protein
MGDLVTITVTALFVKGSSQDLLGGKSVNLKIYPSNIGFRPQYLLVISFG